MTTAWAHLPNAIHIDVVLSSVKEHTAEWAKAYCAAYDITNADHSISVPNLCVTKGVEALKCAHTISNNTKGDSSTRASAYCAAYDTINALIERDDSAGMLNSTPEEIMLLAKLGHPYAILMFPAVTAFANINVVANS